MFRKRTRALSVTERSLKFYHVTLESNLPLIQQNGLDPNFGGSKGGISYLQGGNFRPKCKSKIHFTSEWVLAKRYVEHFTELLEKNNIDNNPPVILELNLLENYYDQQADPDEDGACYYTYTPIKPENISILVSPYPKSPNGEEKYLSGNQHEWLPIQEWNNQQFLPTYIEHPSLKRQRSGYAAPHELTKTQLSSQFFYTPVEHPELIAKTKRAVEIIEDLNGTASPLKKSKFNR